MLEAEVSVWMFILEIQKLQTWQRNYSIFNEHSVRVNVYLFYSQHQKHANISKHLLTCKLGLRWAVVNQKSSNLDSSKYK